MNWNLFLLMFYGKVFIIYGEYSVQTDLRNFQKQ